MNQVHSTLLASGKTVPVSKLCKWMGLARSSAYYQPRQRKPRPLDEAMAARIKRIHHEEPACGVRGTWSRLRYRDKIVVTRKKVHRIMKLKGVDTTQTTLGTSTTRQSIKLLGLPAQPTLGNRLGHDPLWQGWLVRLCSCDRLLYPRDPRPRLGVYGQSQNR
jgi:hypothetical protein